jgi:hypothetical protein
MSTFVAPVYALTAWMKARMRVRYAFEWYCWEAKALLAGPQVVAYSSAEV